MTRVLVCGGRNFADMDFMDEQLIRATREFGVFTLMIDGQAKGADTLAHQWAFARGLAACRFPANWAHHNKAAGPIRNTHMLRYGKPDLVIAFPGGTGTADMTSKAEDAGVKVLGPDWFKG